jgi:hypothetical protein
MDELNNLNPETLIQTDKKMEGSGNKPAYEVVIEEIENQCETILIRLEESRADKEELTAIINELYNITAMAKHLSFHACVRYASLKNRSDIIDKVSKHPLMKVIAFYLFCAGAEGIYLNWNLEVFTIKSWFGLKKKSTIRIIHTISMENPFA